MGKNLNEMTLEELWELFPIVLVGHNPSWKEWADSETASLSVLLARFSPTCSHIGSTAIPAIKAKPIIDILVEVQTTVNWDNIRTTLENNGYICMSAGERKMSFNKGYTPAGYAEKVFHIHIRNTGDNDEVYFRDYLNSHPDTAKEYENLKLSLLPAYTHNRDGYTEAKTEFVKKITEKARGNQSILGLKPDIEPIS